MVSINRQDLQIAFVAGSKHPTKFTADPAFIYRCQNPALALTDMGYSVDCLHYTELMQQKKHYHFVIFHRPSARSFRHYWSLRRRLKRLNQNGSVLLADFDDLVFDPQWAASSPGVINGYVSLQQTKKNFSQHAKMLAFFDHLSVSTEPLKNNASTRFDSTAITWLPNAPFYGWRDRQTSPTRDDRFVIKYLPGTKSHDRDFATIAEPLADFLSQHKDAQLNITGVLNQQRLPRELQRLAPQIQWQPKQPFNDYWRVVNEGHVHLAPLQDSIFNSCKSALKAIEAGYFDRPTIASPIPDMQRFVEAGATIANTQDDWFGALTQQYQTVGQKSQYRQAVVAQFSAEQHAKQLLAVYEQHQ